MQGKTQLEVLHHLPQILKATADSPGREPLFCLMLQAWGGGAQRWPRKEASMTHVTPARWRALKCCSAALQTRPGMENSSRELAAKLEQLWVPVTAQFEEKVTREAGGQEHRL